MEESEGRSTRGRFELVVMNGARRAKKLDA